MKDFSQRIQEGLEVVSAEVSPIDDNAMAKYLKQLAEVNQRTLGLSDLDRKFRITGMVVDPIDPDLGVDMNRFYDTGFYLGTTLGLRVVAHAFDTPTIKDLGKSYPDFTGPMIESRKTPPSAEAIQTIHSIAQKIIDDGNREYYQHYSEGDFDLSERVAEAIEDIMVTPYVRAGMGYLFTRTNDAWTNLERERMLKEADSFASLDVTDFHIPEDWL